MAADAKSKSRRRLVIAVIIVIVVILLVVYLLWPGSPGGSSSGQTNLTGIDVEWNGATYVLLDTAYSSSQYGNDGFTLSAQFNASGACPSPSGCFNPGTSFSLTSATPGFTVSWVTACYQSKGYPALVGPIYFRYAPNPSSLPSGCGTAGTDVVMTGIPSGTLVYITVAVSFPASGFSGALTLQAAALSSSQSVSETVEDTTALAVSCTPGVVLVQAPTMCTVTVNDTAASPRADSAPTGYVNFTASSGQFGPGTVPSCTLQPTQSKPSSSATCTLNYVPSTLGAVTIFAGYPGDELHASASAAFGLETFEYTLSVSPTNQSVAQGSGASYTVTATLETGSATSHLPNITLSVQTCETGSMSCAFSRAEIVPTSSGATATLTITPTTGAVQVPYSYSFAVVGTTGVGDFTGTLTSNDAFLTVT